MDAAWIRRLIFDAAGPQQIGHKGNASIPGRVSFLTM
jgi:hypothetical protein